MSARGGWRVTAVAAIAMMTTMTMRTEVVRADAARADELFKQGKKLQADKRFAEACKAFEDSFAAEPAIGAELNLANCYEDWGKTAHAYRAYQLALKLATDKHDERVQRIQQLLADLEPTVPKLSLKLPGDVELARVKIILDGSVIATTELPGVIYVDPGPHKLEWRGHDGSPRNKTFPMERAAKIELTLDASATPAADLGLAAGAGSGSAGAATGGGSAGTAASGDDVDYVGAPAHRRRLLGLATAAVGAAVIIGSGIETLRLRSRYNNAISGECGGNASDCDTAGLNETHHARSEANVATIFTLVGVAAVAGGVVLYVTAPRSAQHNSSKHKHKKAKDDDQEDDSSESGGDDDAMRIAPTIAPGGAGFVLSGGF